MLSIEKINQLLEPVMSNNGIANYKASYVGGKTKTLEICIEKEDGTMDLDTCEIMSNLISAVLDGQDGMDEAYMLDVCSFGAEKVLETKEDILRHVGDYIHVELLNPANGLDTVEGTLDSYEESTLKITYLVKGIKKHAAISDENLKLIRLAVKL